MSVDTAALRKSAADLWDSCTPGIVSPAVIEARHNLRSAADELDKMCTALAMEPHISEQLDAERAAHAETRSRLESAEALLTKAMRQMADEDVDEVDAYFARYPREGGGRE